MCQNYTPFLCPNIFFSHVQQHLILINIYHMSNKQSTLQKIPLFPFTYFLRINGEMEHNSDCGGIASIVAIGLVLAILALKLVEVFKMETVISSFQTSIDLEPPMTNVSTYQNTTSSFPYMAAIGYYQDMFYGSSASAVAYYYEMPGVFNSTTNQTTPIKTLIQLETCTEQHFSVIANISEKRTSWGYDSWKCLPLNKIWLVGGDQKLSSIYRRIQFEVNCTYSENTKDCGYYKLYTLNSFINPSDAVNPSTYYIRADVFQLKNGAYYQFTSRLDRNVLITDTTVLPAQQLNITTSLESNRIIMQQVMDVATLKQTIVKIQKSVRSTEYKRAFLKLLDAAAYAGGMFNSILAIFFFMRLYHRFHFEMRFAEYYFNCKQARNIGFFSWLKLNVYNVVSATPCKPDWPVEEKRNFVTDTVNKVLDIFYLHKRIGFLEQSLTILFEPHQIKGLHLVHSLTREEADETAKNYTLRDRVVVYLTKYNHVQTFGALGISPEKEIEKISDDLPGNQNQIRSTSILRGESPKKMNKIVNQATEKEQSSEDPQEEVRRESVRQIQKILEDEYRNVGEMTDEQLDEEDLIEEMTTDLKRLFEEGQRKDGDPRSRKVFEKLQPWLKDSLVLATKNNLFTKNLVRRRTSQ